MRSPPVRWPDKARIAIIPCVVMETWPEELGTPSSQQSELRKGGFQNARFPVDLCSVTDRQYGERVGVFRTLDILAEEGVKTSFFVNGSTVEAFPEIMKEILDHGHELCSENYRHEYVVFMTPEEQRATSSAP